MKDHGSFEMIISPLNCWWYLYTCKGHVRSSMISTFSVLLFNFKGMGKGCGRILFFFFVCSNTDIIKKVSVIYQLSVWQFPGKFHGSHKFFWFVEMVDPWYSTILHIKLPLPHQWDNVVTKVGSENVVVFMTFSLESYYDLLFESASWITNLSFDPSVFQLIFFSFVLFDFWEQPISPYKLFLFLTIRVAGKEGLDQSWWVTFTLPNAYKNLKFEIPWMVLKGFSRVYGSYNLISRVIL